MKLIEPLRERVEIVEVAPRDGFQSIAAPLPTQEKIDIIQMLIAAGVKRMELGSFVSPKAVPQMADMGHIAAAFRGRDDIRLSVLVPNAKGAELALANGCNELVYVFSVSETHNLKNVRQKVAQSLEELQAVVQLVGSDQNSRLRIDLATAFDCPFDGATPVDAVRRTFAKAFEIAPYAEFCLCDTTGRADPISVKARFESLRADCMDVRWAFHGHDTYGMGVVNALYAYQAGVSIIEGAAGGLGGCPFAPGASGNTATESLIFAFERGGIDTGIDMRRFLTAADRIAALPGGESSSGIRLVPRERVLA